MSKTSELIAGVGLGDLPRKSHWPARMDLMQSTTGLLLALFMWGHMFFVASILISKDAMWTVTKIFEGYFVFERSHTGIVSSVVGTVVLLFVGHAFLAMRKFPANFRQYRAFIAHRRLFRHADTTLWWVQFLTGFLMFFLACPHLFQMLTHPGAIGPFASGERVFTAWWPLYLVLLFAVELHGGIGLYRLSVKWGWFDGRDANATRRRLSYTKWGMTAFFLVLGLLTLAAYYRIGLENRDMPGIRYVPVSVALATLENAP